MAETPFSVGSGKPLISRVPKGGGSALRPRPVPGAKAPELSTFPGTPQGREGLDLPVEAPAGAALAAMNPVKAAEIAQELTKHPINREQLNK